MTHLTCTCTCASALLVQLEREELLDERYQALKDERRTQQVRHAHVQHPTRRHAGLPMAVRRACATWLLTRRSLVWRAATYSC